MSNEAAAVGCAIRDTRSAARELHVASWEEYCAMLDEMLAHYLDLSDMVW